MKIILGIGNPGRKYENTRHNIGFIVLDKFAEKHNIIFKTSKYDYYEARPTHESGSRPSYLLVKPSTYVNLSGNAALDLLELYNYNIEDLLIVTDDLNLDLGRIRVRPSGGDGGHNGIHSIIYQLQTDKFPRLRFGIGNDFSDGKMKDYVLSKINDEEFKFLIPSFDFSILLLEAFIEGGTKKMLDTFSKNSQLIKLTSKTTNNEDNRE